MKTNKIDNSIKKKFENRTFEPSASAWERLSIQLDEQPKQKKNGWFFYISAAASVLLLITIGIKGFNNNSEEIIPNNDIVVSPIDKNLIDKKIEKFINEIPIQEALVKEDRIQVKTQLIIDNSNNEELKPKNIKSTPAIKEKSIIAKVEEIKENVISVNKEKNLDKNSIVIDKKSIKPDLNNTIKINADDLLYAVTHSPKQVKAYYAKHNVNREDILKTIKNELRKSNLKVNPKTILAEVERNIDDDDFQNNFMKSLKRRVTDIASAIASRNN